MATENSAQVIMLDKILKDFIKSNIRRENEISIIIDKKIGDFFSDGEKFTRHLEIKYPEKKEISRLSNPHKEVENLVKLAAARHNIYLYGPAGTGKSTGAYQVAEALGLQYAYASLCPQSSETLLFGFMHAGGQYVETEFHRLYKDGGVFCIDEMDNGSAQLLNRLNSLLENGHGSFPCGTIPRHKDFILIATGNTNGNGASLEFPDRRAFDPAFKERFVFLHWPLDEMQEKLITLGINGEKGSDWLNLVRAIRQAVKTLGIERLTVSPRAAYRGAALLASGDFKKKQILDMVIFKGIPEDTRVMILKEAKKIISPISSPKEEDEI